MQIPNPENIKSSQILKISGIAIVLIIILVFAVRLTSSSYSSITRKGISTSQSMGMAGVAYDKNGNDYDGEEMALSVRNVAGSGIVPPRPNTIPGDNAEEFEVTEYNASIESRDKNKICSVFEDLKKNRLCNFRKCEYT